MRTIKALFILFFILISGVFIYFTPYFLVNSIFKAVNNNKDISPYINERLIENNIFIRYQKKIFSDIDVDSLMPEQLKKKQLMEDSVKYGIDLLIEKENLVYLFKSVQEGSTEDKTPVEYYFHYADMNTFIMTVIVKDNKQELVFARKNIILWELQDIIFETDINIFNN